jgi:hypothetical protein
MAARRENPALQNDDANPVTTPGWRQFDHDLRHEHRIYPYHRAKPMACNLLQNRFLNKHSAVAAVGFAIDAAHVDAGRAAVAELFGEDLAQLVDTWQTTTMLYAPILIVLAPVDPTKRILVMHVTERANMPRMLEHAINTLRGARCAWLLELNEVDRAVADRVMREVAERVSYGVALEDLEPAGAA